LSKQKKALMQRSILLFFPSFFSSYGLTAPLLPSDLGNDLGYALIKLAWAGARIRWTRCWIIWATGIRRPSFFSRTGKSCVEHYYGTFTVDSVWYWASAGKSLTAFTVGIAQQEGHLSISDTTSQYLGHGWTACPPVKEDLITIRHQLTMTTGLDDGVPDDHCTLDSCLQYLADAGTRWAYHNAPYTLLDSVIESATGQTLNSYLYQKISLPTGILGLYLPSDTITCFTARHGAWLASGFLC
jgi:hypothetical protein